MRLPLGIGARRRGYHQAPQLRTIGASPLWQITFENAIVGLDGGGLDGGEPAYTGILQPFMPVNLRWFGLGRFEWARDFRVITQLTVPFVATTPLPPGAGSDRKSGFGAFAGDSALPRASQLCLEYVLLRQLPRRWQVGMQPSMVVDWTASQGNKVSFPVGPGVGKTVRTSRSSR
jgi:hypothetical protein